MSIKQLIVGPWVGEFGWELFAWQAYMRSLSQHYDNTVVICRSSSQALYADFADEFISLPQLSGLADSFFMHGVDTNRVLKEVLQSHTQLFKPGTTLIPPRRLGMPPFTPCTQSEVFGERHIIPHYLKFGDIGDKPYDYIFHIRDRDLRKEDNWSLTNWKHLRDKLQNDGSTIACIGTSAESAYIEGTTDLRDGDLATVFDVIRNSDCVFGPSSGPMHLASLCGAPHVVWSKEGNRDRYINTWNPHATPVLFLSEKSWHPTPEYVFAEFNKWRKEWKL